MITTSKIKMDLTRPGVTPLVHAVQADRYSRNLEIALYSDGKPFAIPEAVSVVIRYSKFDGKGGEYDTLPDGTQAWSAKRNVLTVALAPQVLTMPGFVEVSIALIVQEIQLSVFAIKLHVQPTASAKIADSEDYFYVTGILPAPSEAEAGQYFRIAAVDENGKITAVEAVTLSGSSGVESDPTVSDWAKKPEKPEYTAQEVGAEPVGTAASAVSAHDSNTAAHEDIRQLIRELAQGITDLGSSTIPDYWQEYLDEKVETIRALQNAAGQNSFSYAVITDSHIDCNLAGRGPALAKYLMDKCGIKYAMHLGDACPRGVMKTKEEGESRYAEIEEMLAPLRDRLLQTQGNHDAAYGGEDWDGDGNMDYYLYNYTPAEMFERIYRKVGLVGNVHFDPAGSNAYYIDDTSNRVRYIVLNTHCTKWELNENGHAKYNNMRIFRYTQAQYDFLSSDALATVPDDHYRVVVCSHVPMNQTEEMPEGDVMGELLKAYCNKTTYTGSYEGTGEAAGGAAYTNLFDQSADGFKEGYRFTSSFAESADTNAIITNYIPYTVADAGRILHLKGIDTSVNGGTRYCRVAVYDSDKNLLDGGGVQLPTNCASGFVQSGYDEAVAVWPLGTTDTGTSAPFYDENTAYIRIGGYLSGAAEDVVVTFDENIQEGSGERYDSVSVDVDFSEAKGTLICYHGGHIHTDSSWTPYGFPIITTRCDAQAENTDALKQERVAGTVTEQSFDIFTVNMDSGKIYATKIGAGDDRVITF